jgi:transcriptional regulator with XRE-family HTH domain
MTMQGEELRSLRKQMNLRQTGLAEALNLTPQFVGMMERGAAPIEPRTEMAVRYLVEHPEARPDVADEDVRSYGMMELAQKLLDAGKLTDGIEWGPWRFDASTMTLDFNSRMVNVGTEAEPQFERREDYYIDLPRCTSPEGVLDRLGQIAGKRWGPAALGYLTQALDDLLDFQGHYVHGKGFQNGNALSEYLRRRLG